MFRLKRCGGRIFALISLYLLLSLPVAFAYDVANFRCEEYKGSGVLAKGSIVEYCTGPSNILQGTEGRKMFFLYAYLGSKTEIVLEYDVDGGGGSCDSYINLQEEGGMQLDPGKITISSDGAFALLCDGSWLNVRPTDDTSVLPHGDCDALINDRYGMERVIDYVAHLEGNEPIEKDLDEIEGGGNHLLLITSAITGATAGFAVMCDIPGTPGSGYVPPEAGVCQTCGGKVEYSSFRIVQATPEEVEEYNLGYDKDTPKWRHLIEITKECELKGERFILERVEMWDAYRMQTNFEEVLFPLDSPQKHIGSRYYFLHDVGNMDDGYIKTGELLRICVDEGYRNKGLASVFNELTIANLLSHGAEEIYVGIVMGEGGSIEERANPYVGKTLKNLRFAPTEDMSNYINGKGILWNILKSTYNDYYFLEIVIKGTPDRYILFIEDENGFFIEGKDFYETTFNGKTEGQVKQIISDFEHGDRNRNIWGQVEYEAKDILYLKTNILDKTVAEPCVCSSPSGTKKAYYLAGGGDVSIFRKFPELDTVVIADTGGDILKVEAMVHGSASLNRMSISNVQVTEVGSGKWEITFNYEGKARKIIYYSRDANTFFPPELGSGYDVYYERLFRGTPESQVLYDMTPKTKLEVIKNLKVGGRYAVFSRWDYMTHKHELAPSLLGLEEVSRTEYSDGWLGHVCEKVNEIPDELLLKILENIYPHAEEAYRARNGLATVSPNVDDNVNIFEGALESIRSNLGDFTDEQKKFIVDSLETDIIKNCPLPKEMPALIPEEVDRLLLETVNKFCEFQERAAVPDVTPICTGGGCYRTSEPLTKESLDVVINGELRGNLIEVTEGIVNDILEELRAEDPNFKGEFAIVYGGSSSYGYTLDGEKASINFNSVVKDLDYLVILSEDLPKNKRGDIQNMVTSRLFDLRNTLFDGRDIYPDNVMFDGTFREIVERLDARNRILMTKNIFIGPSALLADIREQFPELKITPDVMGTGLGKIIDGSLGAEFYAKQGEYGKACKRLAQAANVMNDKELTSEIITEYINHPADMKGTYDHYLPLIRDKIKEFVSLLEVQHKIKAINRRVEYYKRINKEIIGELKKQYYLDGVDVHLLVDLDDKLKDMLRELEDDTILIEPEDKAKVKSIIEATRDYVRELRMAPEIIDYMGLPAEEVARNRITHFNALLEEFNRVYYDDYIEVLSEGGEIAEKYKELVDAGKLEPTQEIVESEESWVEAIEKNIEIADKLDRQHDSEYSGYGRKVRGEAIKKLRDIGRSKYARYGSIAGLVLSVLSMEAGERLNAAGYDNRDIYLTKIGFYMHIGGLVVTLAFIAPFLLAAIRAICTMNLPLLIVIAAGAMVCYWAIELIISTADYLVCEMEWSKKVGIGTYSLYELLCTAPIIHVKLNDASGNTICDYTDRWSGQREIACP